MIPRAIVNIGSFVLFLVTFVHYSKIENNILFVLATAATLIPLVLFALLINTILDEATEKRLGKEPYTSKKRIMKRLLFAPLLLTLVVACSSKDKTYIEEEMIVLTYWPESLHLMNLSKNTKLHKKMKGQT